LLKAVEQIARHAYGLSLRAAHLAFQAPDLNVERIRAMARGISCKVVVRVEGLSGEFSVTLYRECSGHCVTSTGHTLLSNCAHAVRKVFREGVCDKGTGDSADSASCLRRVPRARLLQRPR